MMKYSCGAGDDTAGGDLGISDAAWATSAMLTKSGRAVLAADTERKNGNPILLI